jgi:hypothetical protein
VRLVAQHREPLRTRRAEQHRTGFEPLRELAICWNHRRRRPRCLRRCRPHPHEEQPLPTRTPEVLWVGVGCASPGQATVRVVPPIEHEGEDGGAGDGNKGDGKRHEIHRIAPLNRADRRRNESGVKGQSAPLDQHLPQDCGCYSHHQEHHAAPLTMSRSTYIQGPRLVGRRTGLPGPVHPGHQTGERARRGPPTPSNWPRRSQGTAASTSS